MPDILFDPYLILGLSPNASDDDIKKSYRKLAQRLHPDKNPNNSAVLSQFQEISEAYSLLSDYDARKKYDREKSNYVSAEDTYFTLRVTPSKRYLSIIPEEQVVYLLAEIFPAPQTKEMPKTQTYLNLTLVLDTSNSMKGSRLDRVKLAAQKIIDDLSPKDTISVVVFNDRATVIISSTNAGDKTSLKARISMISPSGSTEMWQGLNTGLQQNRIGADNRFVNSVILITDGHTYGDEENCFELAKQAVNDGITISAMGLGSDWNDNFLDKLASLTGGTSSYIDSTDKVVRFLNDHVRSLSNAFAERLQLSIAPDPDIKLEMAFRLSPNPQPLLVDDYNIPLSSLQINRPISILLQFLLPGSMQESFRTLVRLVVTGDILRNKRQAFKAISDVSGQVSNKTMTDEPPSIIMEALSKLTLYRLQEKARLALEKGDADEATRRLNTLATRLLEIGESELAKETLVEAQRVSQTKALSAQGKMTIKYQTRALLSPGGLDSVINSLRSSD
jgi:Ca-activated chloride channel homolog